MIKFIKLILKGINNFFKNDDYKQDHIHDKQEPTYITGIGYIKKDKEND